MPAPWNPLPLPALWGGPPTTHQDSPPAPPRGPHVKRAQLCHPQTSSWGHLRLTVPPSSQRTQGPLSNPGTIPQGAHPIAGKCQWGKKKGKRRGWRGWRGWKGWRRAGGGEGLPGNTRHEETTSSPGEKQSHVPHRAQALGGCPAPPGQGRASVCTPHFLLMDWESLKPPFMAIFRSSTTVDTHRAHRDSVATRRRG